MAETAAGDEPLEDDASTEPEDPWRSLRRQQDRRRYLRVLAPRRTGKEKPRRLNPAVGVPREAHALLGPPSSITRTVSHTPPPMDVRNYLRHSADLTMRGGNAAGLVYPLAACALAEHYVFRRVAGSSSGAIAAAMTAAAELGRGAPSPAQEPVAPAVNPGFGGLAEVVGWLAGADGVEPPGEAEAHRMAGLLQPAAGRRGAYRMLVAALGGAGFGHLAVARVLLAGLSLLAGVARALLVVIAAGLAVGWLGLVSALVAGTRAGAIDPWVTVGAAMVLLIVFGFAGLAIVAVVEIVTMAGRLRTAERDNFGLVPGAAPAGPVRPAGRVSRWLDRRSGVPEPDGSPVLFDWVADRLDDLAGIPADPAGDDSGRRALTIGDLWAGSVEERTAAQNARLRAAALDPEQRVVNLLLVSTDLSSRRPYRLPFLPAEQAERLAGARFLFCESCLAGLLPARVVSQLVKAAPSTANDHVCPRHDGRGSGTDAVGVLRELPEPWDLPVVFAARLSFSPPGLLRAVPLYAITEVRRGERQDAWGQPLVEAGRPAGPASDHTAVRTHWFTDGGLTSNVPVSYFDALLPRWPTFAINLEDTTAETAREMLRVPAQDAGAPQRSWRSVGTVSGLLSALLDTSMAWRDSAQADLPGFRGRVAMLRRTPREKGVTFLLPQRTVLALAVRGLRAGATLREVFTGSDDQVPGQTQTDRYRWVRFRMALREYKGLSMDIGARLPLYRDLASSYHVPDALTGWFDPPQPPAERDPLWADAANAVVTLRALTAGGVLDFDADRGAPPADPDLRLLPPE